MHLSRSHHEKNPELESHGPRMIPPTTSRDTRRYSDDSHHRPSRSGHSEYSHSHDKSYRNQESYSPPPHHRSRHDDYDDYYDDRSRSDRHRDRSRHSTRHHSTHRSHSTHRRRESGSPSYYQDRRRDDDDRPRSDGHHHQKSSDHGQSYQPPISSHHSRPAFERRRSRSVDERYLSRPTRSKDAPVYYHYQSGSYYPIPLSGNDLNGAARARASSTSQGAAVMSPSGRQPMVVPVDGGRGGWIVVPPGGHSVSVMEPQKTAGHSTATTVADASALHRDLRRSSIAPEAMVPQSALPIQPTTTINIAHPYASVQPTTTPGHSTHHHSRQQVLQPIQRAQTTTPSEPSRRRSPQQTARMPPSHRRPHKLVFPQLLSGAPPSTSPRSAGVATTYPTRRSLAPPGHPMPTTYTTPYRSGHSGSGSSGSPTSQKKSGFGWGFFGSRKNRRSRGTSL